MQYTRVVFAEKWRNGIMSQKYIVTVTRQFASNGRQIAERLSELLGISCLDRELIDDVAKALDLSSDEVDKSEESARKTSTNPFNFMTFHLGGEREAVKDRIFAEQQKMIREMAEKESCVIIGRCADYALADMDHCIHVYIYASYAERVNYCVKYMDMAKYEAQVTIQSLDAERDAYYMNYAGFLPNDEMHKDIMIDSSLLGIEGTAQLLAEMVKQKLEIWEAQAS